MICDTCALRIFNPKHYNLPGIGNPYYGNCIVIPNVDYNAYKHNDIGYSEQVKIVQASLSSTGELVNRIYFVPLIRCNELVTTKIDQDSLRKCITHFGKDVHFYDFKHILLLGDAVTRMLDITITDNLNNIYLTENGKRMYFINYSPLIKFKDEKKFNIFLQQLNKWINTISSKDYSQYNIIQL